MQKNIYQLVLGSASPRRKELLAHTYLPFIILTADLDETSEFKDPVAMVQDLATQKAQHVYQVATEVDNPFVIGADTIVVVDNTVLGKPKDTNEARVMLQSLAGKTHQVYTGVAFCWDGKQHTFYDCTDVTFNAISSDLMDFYLKTGESLDKAGSYGIQGAALGFIGEVKGSYSNVVGLPVDKVIANLKRVLNAESDDQGEWRKCFYAG
jgi:septum formation protein